MKKRILSFAIALVMASICFCAVMTEPAAAATQYMTMNADYGTDEIGTPREKVGKYYIWVENEIENNVMSAQLKCTTSLKKKAKVLKTVRAKSKELASRVITNGSTIFYLVQEVGSSGRAKCTIYKTTIKSGKSKKIKTITNIEGIASAQLAACHNGRIYYNVWWFGKDPVDLKIDLYSCTLGGQNQRLEKENYVVRSSYGKYMTGNICNQDGGNYTQVLYNVKTKKAKSLLSAADSVVYGDVIYYYITYGGAGTNKFAIKKSNLNGKNIINIKTGKDVSLSYLGKRTAYFYNYGTGVIKKLVYKTKKLTTVGVGWQ